MLNKGGHEPHGKIHNIVGLVSELCFFLLYLPWRWLVRLVPSSAGCLLLLAGLICVRFHRSWKALKDAHVHVRAGSSGADSSGMHTPSSSLMRHPDRGAGFYRQKRERHGRASLVETGR